MPLVTGAVVPALADGLGAGLGVALPLGAIGVLILQQGLTRGWRAAWPAATGVALVDLGYAALATAAGSWITRLLAHRARTVQLLGAIVLFAVVVRGLAGLRRPARAPDGGAGEDRDRTPDGSGDDRRHPLRVMRRFIALTAVNPLTAVYFVVLAAGLGRLVSGRAAASAFVLGEFLASLAWQLVLAATGSLAGARLPPWARTATGVAGYLIVAGYAVRLATG